MVGYELEFLVREDNMPLTKRTFLKFHEELRKRGWKQKFDPDTRELLGSQNGNLFVTTDDGVNNMEIPFPPTETLGESHERASKILAELQEIYKTLGASMVGVGVFPGPADFDAKDCTQKCTASRICGKSFIQYVVPKRWTEHHLTQLFAGQHIWLDLPNKDIVRQLLAMNRLNPFLVALFANGPVFNQKPLGVLEGRNALWMRQIRTSVIPYDFGIYGMYPKEYQTVFAYLDFILDMPFYFSNRDGVSFRLANPQTTFREFFSAKATPAEWGHGGTFIAKPTLEDFAELQHATFPNARLKFFIQDGVSLAEILAALDTKDEKKFVSCFKNLCVEVRTNSQQPKDSLSAGPAFLLGLQSNLERTERFLSQYSYGFLVRLFDAAERTGLETMLDGITIADACRELILIAEEGLKKRGFAEEQYLPPLKERVAKKENPAQEILKVWNREGLAEVWEARDY